jgi:hypothetical protein
MAEKTYLTPNAREPEFVVVPKGAINEQGIKLKRIAIKFYPNARKVGQFITSDPKQQEWLEGSEWFKLGKMILLKGHIAAPTDAPEQTQTTGPVSSEGAVRKKRKVSGID